MQSVHYRDAEKIRDVYSRLGAYNNYLLSHHGHAAYVINVTLINNNKEMFGKRNIKI